MSMIVIDNKDYLIKEIEKTAQKELDSLDKEYQDKIAVLKESEEDRLSKELKSLKESNTKELARLKKQKVSSFELQSKKQIMLKQNEIFDRVVSDLKTYLEKSDKKTQESVLKSMVKRLEEMSAGNIVKFKTPKDIKIPQKKCEDTLKDFMVIAIGKNSEEYEMSLDDLIKDNFVKIHRIVKDKLW